MGVGDRFNRVTGLTGNYVNCNGPMPVYGHMIVAFLPNVPYYPPYKNPVT
jgi:hypothetical protein